MVTATITVTVMITVMMVTVTMTVTVTVTVWTLKCIPGDAAQLRSGLRPIIHTYHLYTQGYFSAPRLN